MTSRKNRILFRILCGILISLAGCTTAPQRPSKEATSPIPLPSGSPEPMGPTPLFGPPEAVAAPDYGPQPIQLRPLVLVLGPGVVRGFAHSGVLEALTTAKVPVGAVLGSEMGALIAAIYAQDTNINHLQWELMKFKEDVFLSERGLFPGHHLEGELSKYFGDKDLHSTKIPCVVALETQNSGIELVSHGLAREALRSAVAFPNMIDPGTWKGGKAFSTRKSLLPLIQEAKSLGIGPVVVIDTAGEVNAASPPSGVDLVIPLNLQSVQDLDFKKRTEAIFRGKKAVTANLKEIFHWAGMPQGE